MSSSEVPCRVRLPRGLPACLLCLCALQASVLLAETPADIDAARRQAEAIQREQQQLLLQDQQRGKRLLPPVGGADLSELMPPLEVQPSDGVCTEIDEIAFEGAELLDPALLRRLSAPSVGRCLRVADIELLLSLVTKEYIERGYVTTRAYLPAQDLKTRRLRILVIEGSIEAYRKEGDDAQRIFVPGAFPGAPGDKLNLRDLEQGVDQLNRLASNRATIDILPGSSPGGSIVVIRNKASLPLHAVVGYDNLGTRQTGKHSASASLTVDNPLGLNDRWLLTGRGSLPREDAHHSDSSSLDLSIPWGRNTFGANIGRSAYLNALQLPSGSRLKTSGTTDTHSVGLERLIFRDQHSRLSFAAKLATERVQNYIANELLALSSRDLSHLDLSVSGSVSLLGGVLSGQAGYVKGLRLFGATQDPADIDTSTPHAQFEKSTLELGFSRPFTLLGQPVSWSSQFFGQYSTMSLYGSQQIAIGSTTSVRGFARNSLGGDRGFYWRNELSLPGEFTVAGERVGGRVYAGFDFGRVSGVATGSPAGSLAGATVGWAAQWRGATWEFFHCLPVARPDTMPSEPAQSWFRLSYAI